MCPLSVLKLPLFLVSSITDFEISKIRLGNRLLRLGLLNKRLLGLQLISEVAEGARAVARLKQLGHVRVLCFFLNNFL